MQHKYLMRLMHSRKTTFIALLTCFTISLESKSTRLMEFTTINTDPLTKEITITFIVPKKDFIYKDFIACSTDEPTVLLSPWKANKQAVAHYDSSFKDAKDVFNEDFTISMTASTTQQPQRDPTYLYCSYYRRSEKKINHTLFPIYFTTKVSATQENSDTMVNTTNNNEPPVRIKKKSSYLDDYIFSTLCIVHTIIASLRVDHRKYFALLIFIILVLCSFSYFFKKELQKQVGIKEFIEVIISLLITVSAAYIIACARAMSTPFITIIMASACTLYAGLFYIEKSTKLQSENLRTFCTFLGMFCICSTLFLLFKALQYADEQFHLL